MKRSRPISRYDTTEATTGAGSSGNHSSRGGFKGKGKGSKRGEGEGGDTNNNKDNGAKSNKSLKNQIRSLERFIKRDGLSPIIVREKQKQIEKLKSAMTAKVTQENERTMATKYHKVKFFERVKVDRRVKQLKKQIASLMEEDDITSGPAAKKLKKFKQQLNEFRNKAKYIKYFPKGEKYISLFVADESDAKLMSTRKELMKAAIAMAKEAEANGELEAAEAFAQAVGRSKREKRSGANNARTESGEGGGDDDDDDEDKSAGDEQEVDDFFKQEGGDASTANKDDDDESDAEEEGGDSAQAKGKKRKIENKEEEENGSDSDSSSSDGEDSSDSGSSSEADSSSSSDADDQ